jgi:hypothetical protein
MLNETLASGGKLKMKKRMNSMFRLSLVFSAAVLLGASAAWAESPGNYALLIQQSPADAGSVSPGSGVHKMEIGQTVSISATPKAGYRFLYWLGDVSSTGTSDTTIQIDSPKMVVAVFTREEYEEELPGTLRVEGDASAGGGGGRFFNPLQSPGVASPTGSYGQTGYGGITLPDIPNKPNDDDIPAPGGDDDIPVPEVPEPTTILLLGLGTAAVLRKNKK